MPLNKFWMLNGSKKRKFSKRNNENIKADDDTIKQIKDLIKIYKIVIQTMQGTEEDCDYSNGILNELKYTLKILEQNKKIEKDKEDVKTEFDIWFNNRK